MKKSMYLIVCMTLLVLLVTINSCQKNKYSQGRDWVTWKGPFANRTTDETGWDANALSDSINILWKADIGKGHSSVAVKGDLVYVFGNKTVIENTDTSTFDKIACLNTNTGSEVWTYKYKSNAGDFPGPCSSPVIDGDNLYAFGRNGDLHCLNAENGEVIWKHQLTDMGYKAPNFGFGASPVIIKNMLVLKVGETGVAFNKQTGEKIWAGDTTNISSYSSVVVFNYSGNEKLMISNGDSLVLVQSETGQKLKSYPSKSGMNDPQIHDSTMLLSNTDEGTVFFSISKNQLDKIWQNDSIGALFQNFTKSGSYAYTFTRKKNKMPLTCINLENGNLEWEKDLGKWGSLIVADNKLVIISGNGQLIIAEASPEQYTEISSQQLFKMEEEDFKRNKNCCWTLPVLSHGRIYVRTTKGELACVNVRI